MGIACIIDDDPIQALIIERMLASYKICDKLLVFKNGLEALQYFQANFANPELVPDIILLDINMPVMNGWQFLDEFKDMRPAIDKKIILYMVSSSIWPEEIEKAKNYSVVTDYIVKPITMQELAKTLKKAGLVIQEN
jgi:CheY-like chemotaxis protein